LVFVAGGPSRNGTIVVSVELFAIPGETIELMAEQDRAEPTGPVDIDSVYQERLGARSRALESSVRLDRRVADLRLVVFFLLVILGFLIYRGVRISPWWAALPGVLFIGLVLWHEPLRRASDRARRAVDFYSRGLARLTGKWAGTGVTGVQYLDLDHTYAADLDLFGKGSLFELLCTARTRAGEEALAGWLLAPATPEVISERHSAVVELHPRLDLREDLELLGVDVQAGIDPAALSAWGNAPRVFEGRWVFITATVLGVLGTSAVIGWIFFETGLLPVLAVLTLDGVFARLVLARVRQVLAAVDQRTHDLVLLSELLRRLEREPLDSPPMRRLAAALKTDGRPASAKIRRLSQLLQLLDCRRNQFFVPFAVVWLWTVQLALRIDAWRAESGHEIPGWLRAVGEFEAFCALACYAAEHPEDPFPELASGPACYEAQGLGHPLIPARECVANDISLGISTRALVVSGSNMSGKSTLLRTVGTNAVLALAGAPVRARRLRLTPVAVGATLRIQDSLQAGRSRFYAEITRVRQLVDCARGPLPLLFLFDELFHGTNSHDRCVGAESVLGGLINQGAIGLITTHDLALAQIAANLAPRAANVHFEDHFEDGKMTFDYLMRPGVVQHSNALALMRAIGLDV
jgi:hypothetical protein